MSAKIYASPGYCIYCGATEGLTDEHIVPLSLNGSEVIDDASCEACRVETCRVEDAVTRLMLAGIRAQRSIKTRRGKARRDLRLRLEVEQDGAVGHVHLAPQDAPLTLVLPQLVALPAILDGREARSDGQLDGKVWVASTIQSWIERSGYQAATMWQPLNTPMFMRMLAKMAHCYVAARMGPDTFEPFLVPFIMGKEADFPDLYIGGNGEPPTAGRHKGAFVLALRHVEREGRVLAVVRIHLFPDLGSPQYLVVVGAMKHATPAIPGKPRYLVIAPLPERGRTGGGSR